MLPPHGPKFRENSRTVGVLINLLAQTDMTLVDTHIDLVSEPACSPKCPLGEPKQVVTADCEFEGLHETIVAIFT